MRAEEIRELSDEEIRSRVAELEEERFRLKFRSATESLESPLRFRAIRKDVARLKTILRQRELSVTPKRGAAKAAAKAAAKGAGTTAAKAAGKRAAKEPAAKKTAAKKTASKSRAAKSAARK